MASPESFDFIILVTLLVLLAEDDLFTFCFGVALAVSEVNFGSIVW